MLLGPIVVLLFAVVMNVTKDYVLEAMGRAEALAKAKDIVARVVARARATGIQHDTGVAPHRAIDGVPDDASELEPLTRADAGADAAANGGAGDVLVRPAADDYLVTAHRKF